MLFLATMLAGELFTKPPKHKPVVPDSVSMTLVQVQNDRDVPVTVYAQNSWGEIKLGVVGADRTAILRVPDLAAMDGDVDFFVHPKGQEDEETGSLDIHHGDRIGIVVRDRK